MRRLLVSLVLLGAFAGLAPAARAGDDILYPRGTGPVRPPALAPPRRAIR